MANIVKVNTVRTALLVLVLGGCGKPEDQNVIEAAMESAIQTAFDAIDAVQLEAADWVDTAGEMADTASDEMDANETDANNEGAANTR